MTKKKLTHFWETNPDKALFHQPFGYWEKNSDWNKDIPQYFKRLNKIKDDRSFAILASTVLEYQVDRFLKCFIPEYQILVKPNTSFDFKLNILRAFRLLPPQIVNSAELIKNIRNEFAHNQDLDNFNDVAKSTTLKTHIELLDKIWKKYETDMVYFKIDKTYLSKFKDIWRKSLEGFRSYEKNITFFRHTTEKKSFIDNLGTQSNKLEAKRVQREQELFIKQKISGK
ncbi:MAG: hypothetical protein KIT80_23025 [Chitinophagaceae bacterium]|nr:hypothetical protein [Chitinophagaceae bacterium]MCW5929812.1 hypothetical protein [Chitinophagaceae bacterium]